MGLEATLGRTNYRTMAKLDFELLFLGLIATKFGFGLPIFGPEALLRNRE